MPDESIPSIGAMLQQRRRILAQQLEQIDKALAWIDEHPEGAQVVQVALWTMLALG